MGWGVLTSTWGREQRAWPAFESQTPGEGQGEPLGALVQNSLHTQLGGPGQNWESREDEDVCKHSEVERLKLLLKSQGQSPLPPDQLPVLCKQSLRWAGLVPSHRPEEETESEEWRPIPVSHWAFG